MRLDELAEVVGTNIDGKPWFDECARFPDPQDLLLICSSLVTVETESKKGTTLSSPLVRLAHFSVKEYLLSERILTQSSACYAMQHEQVNDAIGAVCIAYLLQFDIKNVTEAILAGKHPLARYATVSWITHAKLAGTGAILAVPLSLQLLQIDRQAYRNWLRLYDMFDQHEQHRYFRFSYIAHPLYMMSHAGAMDLVQYLLKRDADVGADSRGRLGFALVGAAQQGHFSIAELLLEHGADPDAVIKCSQDRDYSSALQAASGIGCESIVRLLINNGADVNIETPTSNGGRTALEAAAAHGHRMICHLLLDAGANVDGYKGAGGPILSAWEIGDFELVALLLKHRPNLYKAYQLRGEMVKFSGHQCQDHLKHMIFIRLKIETQMQLKDEYAMRHARLTMRFGDPRLAYMAEIQIRAHKSGGQHQDRLETASYIGDPVSVQDLIDKGAKPGNASSSPFRGALIATACSVWYRQYALNIAKILIENGADVNVVSEVHGTALQAASHNPFGVDMLGLSWSRRHDFIKMLIDNGADVNALGPYGKTALQSTSEQCDYMVIKQLLDNGADPNLRKDPHECTALHAALGPKAITFDRLPNLKRSTLVSRLGSQRAEVVELLLEHGAKIG